MSSAIERLMALKQQMLAAVVSQPKGAKRSTVKGQRKASKATIRGKVAKRAKALNAANAAVLPVAAGWTPPVTFTQWVKWHKTEVLFSNDPMLSIDKAHQPERYRIGQYSKQLADKAVILSQAQLRAEYEKYKQAKFDEPIRWSGTDGNAFDKIVKREAWLERSGKADLGLLGYSAMDRVQLAIWYAVVDRICAYLRNTAPSLLGVVRTADAKYIKEMGQALRDLRSDDELRKVAERAHRARYTVDGDTNKDGMPRLRKQSQTEAVLIAARRLELRAEFRAMPIAQHISGQTRAKYSETEATVPFEYSSFTPTVGEVYKKIRAVTQEGLRQFRNTLEGLTLDGTFSDAAEYIAGHRADLAEAKLDRALDRLDKSMERNKAEDLASGMFNVYDVNERAIMQTLSDIPSYTVAEANAKVFLQGLVDKYTLDELREVFSELSERAFSRLKDDAALLVAEAKETNLFHANKFLLLEELATEAFTA
jgi:hypothetical protein